MFRAATYLLIICDLFSSVAAAETSNSVSVMTVRETALWRASRNSRYLVPSKLEPGVAVTQIGKERGGFLQVQLKDDGSYGQVDKNSVADVRTALERFSEQLAANNYATRVYVYRGNAFFEIGDYDNAQADFSRAIKLEAPNRAAAFLGRAKVQKELIRLSPSASKTLSFESDRLSLVGPQDLLGAIEFYASNQASLIGFFADASSCINLEPHRAGPHIERSKFLLSIAPTAAMEVVSRAALNDFSKAIRSNPYAASAYSERSHALDRLGGEANIPLANADRAEVIWLLQGTAVLNYKHFTISTTEKGSQCEPADDLAAKQFLPALVKASELYPPDLFRKAGVRQIVLCANLASHDMAVPGVFDPKAMCIYFDVKKLSNDASHAVNTIHHEVFHAIDYRLALEGRSLEGDVFAMSPRLTREDALQREGAHCPPPNGYVRWYAQVGPNEDKACTFAEMVTRPRTFGVRDKDNVLQRKLNAIRTMAIAFDDRLDEFGFWSKAAIAYRD